jgi:hypothetical protein
MDFGAYMPGVGEKVNQKNAALQKESGQRLLPGVV